MSRSLTIKQMTMVSLVTLVAIGIFILVLLFNFVQQRRDDFVYQLKDLAHTVEQPLSEALVLENYPKAQEILNGLSSVGILSRADILLANEFQLIHGNFPREQSVPIWINRVFDLPVQISVPLYPAYTGLSLDEPLGYLVLQVDSFRFYRFILNMFSTLLVTYLLLVLVLTVAISWCLKRLVVYPLRDLSQQLSAFSLSEKQPHQLEVAKRHRDDELGVLVRLYNHNQTELAKVSQSASMTGTRFPLTGLPNEALFLELLHQNKEGQRARTLRGALFLIQVEGIGEGDGLQGEAYQAQIEPIMHYLNHYARRYHPVAQLDWREFVLILPAAEPRLQDALARAQQIHTQLQGIAHSAQALQGVEFRIGVSAEWHHDLATHNGLATLRQRAQESRRYRQAVYSLDRVRKSGGGQTDFSSAIEVSLTDEDSRIHH